MNFETIFAQELLRDLALDAHFAHSRQELDKAVAKAQSSMSHLSWQYQSSVVGFVKSIYKDNKIIAESAIAYFGLTEDQAKSIREQS